MPIIGNHERRKPKVKTPKSIALSVMLTYERAGLLTATLESFRKATPDMQIIIYDDGSKSEEKLKELDAVEELGFTVNREPHRGLVRTWMKVFSDLRETLDVDWSDDQGVVFLEDDLLFAKGWDETLLKMASGVEALGLKPGAMTCFRCHYDIQAQIHDLNGVEAYQSMQHGFQVNMFPLWVMNEVEVLEEAALNSENGGHGIDVWLIGGLAHHLDLTSFMSVESWVAHVGAGRSVAESQGYKSFDGVGYNLVHGLSSESGQLF
jgi:glycosyltransferase involved in cell wall biosynthesis